MTDEQTKKRGPKRSYVEIQRANRATEIKNIELLKGREEKAREAYEALRAQRESREAALNAPIDPDMAEVVAGVVGKVVTQTDPSKPVLHVGKAG